MAFAAHGYAHGARLARQLGGWQTITWVLVLTLPVNLVLSVLALAGTGAGPAPVAALLGLAYVSVFSAYVGFFPWYKGLALGGIAQVGQMQLLQPFFTVLFGALLLGEALDGALWGYLVAVIACVALGRKAG
jgi:drug/metabolite transporter (DMT)-like permease